MKCNVRSLGSDSLELGEVPPISALLEAMKNMNGESTGEIPCKKHTQHAFASGK